MIIPLRYNLVDAETQKECRPKALQLYLNAVDYLAQIGDQIYLMLIALMLQANSKLLAKRFFTADMLTCWKIAAFSDVQWQIHSLDHLVTNWVNNHVHHNLHYRHQDRHYNNGVASHRCRVVIFKPPEIKFNEKTILFFREKTCLCFNSLGPIGRRGVAICEALKS